VPPNDLINALNGIHSVLCFPFDWTSDTPEDIANIMAGLGYKMTAEDVTRRLHEEGLTCEDDEVYDEIVKCRPSWAR